MRTPLFIDENGDLSAFDSVEGASRYLEAIDVDAGIYVGYDAAGVPLKLRTVRLASRAQRVVVIEPSGEPAREADLARLLEKRLRAVGVAVDETKLEPLVSAARDRFRTD